MRQWMAVLLILLLGGITSACGGAPPASGSGTPNESGIPMSGESGRGEVRAVTKPADLPGEPAEIILVTQRRETAFGQGTQEYQDILELLSSRFPEELKEAAMAFEWREENGEGVDWSRMAEDFDYLRLAYGEEQVVRIQCLTQGHGDGYQPEITFTHMVFPLTGDKTALCIVGTKNSFGVLEDSGEVLAGLRGR